MSWKKIVNDYLVFSRKERIGLLALLLLILFIIMLPGLISNKSNPSNSTADTAWITAVKKLENKEITIKENKSFNPRNNDDDYSSQSQHYETTSRLNNLFYFDPNTLNEKGWEKLGISAKTINIIQNYLNKGGHFYKSEDLQKIYSIRQADFEKLVPYIKIETTQKENYHIPNSEKGNESKHLSPGTIDINTADTSAFIALPGIGSKLAARIILFREKLGGFYSITQIADIYGLSDSTFQKVKPYLILKETELKKININTATKDEMKAHPYIKWSLANIIVEYRNQHGNFNSLATLKNISAITDSVYNKIIPYFIL